MTVLRNIFAMTSSAALSLAILLSPAAAQEEDEVVIRSVPIGNLQVLDPIWTTAYITRNHGYMVWDTLFAMDANGDIQPQMVDTWEVSEDGLTWTFTLRDGLLWHDGQPVTSEDIIPSIQRWGAKDGMGQVLMEYTAGLRTIDENTFEITLTEPVGFMLEALGKIDSNVPFMMPKRLAETDPNEQIEEVIGSGPFRFVEEEWEPGNMVVYEKFEDYVPRDEPASLAAGGKVVHVDRVESVYMPDAGVAVAAIANGEVDLLESPPTDLLELLESDPNVVLTPNDPLGYQLFMVVNHLHPPFDDRAARRALLWGMQQSNYMAAMIGDPDRWQECAAIFGCGTASETQAGADAILGHDLERAKTLLAESEYNGDPIILMDPADNATLHPAALVAAESLREIGFNVQVEAMDWSTLTQRRASKAPPEEGGWNVFVTNATITGISNPLLNTFVKNCEQSWYGWPCDQRIVDLNQEWGLATDQARQAELTEQIQQLHYDNVTYVPLGQYRPAIAYRSALEGIIESPALFYWNIRKTSE